MPTGKPAQRYRCTICKEFKRESSFPKCKRTVTGVKTTCTMCQRSIYSKWYHSNGGKKHRHDNETRAGRMKKRKLERAMLSNAERMKLGIDVEMMVPGLALIQIGHSFAAVRLRTAKFMKEREPDNPFWDQFIKEDQ